MQDFGTKADDTAGPSGQLSAAEFNNLATELENSVLRSGVALSGASVSQLAGSLFLHGVKSQVFQDSGAANAYVATPVSGSGGTLLPADYAPLNGALITFQASNANSGASTLNLGQTTGTLLGTKAIVQQNGSAITSGAISAGAYIQLRYDSSIGAGSWVLLPWALPEPSMSLAALNTLMSVTVASATANLTADAVVVSESISGKSYRLAAFSKTINLATTGAGGMDTGTAPVSGYVAIYAIYNPSTGVSALLALNATSVAAGEIYSGINMPSGFTASCLLTVVPTNASSQFKVCYVSGRGVGVTITQVYTSSVAVGATPISIAAAVPINAKEFSGEIVLSNGSSGSMNLAVLSSSSQISQQIEGGLVALNQTCVGSFSRVMLITPQTTTVVSSSSGGTPTFAVFVSRYEV